MFHISQADLSDISDDISISIDVYVSADYNISLLRTYDINGNANIEYDVNEFHFYPESINSMDGYALPSNTLGEYQGIREILPFIAKAEA